MKYFCPNNITELHEMLYKEKGSSVTILAGGTDLIPRWNNDPDLKPQILIDIKKLGGYSGIRKMDEEIIIGALTTIQEIKNSPLLQNEFPALTAAANQFAGVQIRHRATIGGNICNASPAGDLLPGLYAYHAIIECLGSEGKRIISIDDLMVGPGKTKLESGEIISGLRIKRKKEQSLFYKLGLRQSMAISVVNFAMSFKKDRNGFFTSLTIAAGCVAPTIVYLDSFAHAVMEGTPVGEAIHLVDSDIAPIDDIRATGKYRRMALKNVLEYTIRHECHEWDQ